MKAWYSVWFTLIFIISFNMSLVDKITGNIPIDSLSYIDPEVCTLI